jgi:hypothetical protein
VAFRVLYRQVYTRLPAGSGREVGRLASGRLAPVLDYGCRGDGGPIGHNVVKMHALTRYPPFRRFLLSAGAVIECLPYKTQ